MAVLPSPESRLKLTFDYWSQGCTVVGNPTLQSIGEKYGKSSAQVAIAWLAQRGIIVIPKSVTAARIAQNREVGFELSAEDMAAVSALNKDFRNGILHCTQPCASDRMQRPVPHTRMLSWTLFVQDGGARRSSAKVRCSPETCCTHITLSRQTCRSESQS